MQMLEGYINVNCAMYIYNIQWIWFNMSLVWAQSSWPNYDLIWCICTYYTMFLIQNKPQGPLDKSFWSICPFHGAIFNTHTQSTRRGHRRTDCNTTGKPNILPKARTGQAPSAQEGLLAPSTTGAVHEMPAGESYRLSEDPTLRQLLRAFVILK